MLQYKVLCSNFPPNKQDLDRMAQEGWEFVGIATLDLAGNIDKHIANKPANMVRNREPVRYTWYFKRIVDDV